MSAGDQSIGRTTKFPELASTLKPKRRTRTSAARINPQIGRTRYMLSSDIWINLRPKGAAVSGMSMPDSAIW